MTNRKIWTKIIWIVLAYLLILAVPGQLLLALGIKGATGVSWQMGFSILLTVLFVWYDHRSDQKIGIEPEPKRSLADILLYGVFGLILFFGVNFVGTLLISLFFGVPQSSTNTQEIITNIHKAPLFAVYAALIAPVLEEIVFRKTLYGLGRRLMNPVGAALISSLLFGLAHNDNRFLIVYAGIGVVQCWLYHKTKSIKVTMAAHIIYNSFALAVALLLPR
ncbi:CPBP family intramembrane glutamic endopeptidase [Lapidilactobacillus luobeiensis]|uniref:CPBP family intramembrane glutamic endopeptidase n=1 Tax=Lapidilactobacillus luobeiensis TaxID=2950371 RepID=UPI0021C2D5E1|nr:type II CAAX endopeptidase family protein [Lapidilactobacillus luobeiensis]